ncbi:MAG: CPBP family intramembrane metalloprotease [Candidatus Diapherotrites archaeon]|nr:CPBP family intramembrane metalloprotease [Candidatus Diapherotrites archaeon]
MLYELLMALFLLFPFLWERVMKKHSWKKVFALILPVNKSKKKELFGALKLFVLLGVISIVISIILSLFGITDIEKVGDLMIALSKEQLVWFIATMIIAVFIEEVFFRAFLQKKTGIIISSAVFAVFHYGYGSIGEIIGAFVLGLILAWWFKKNNSILQNYLGHLLYNIFAIVIYLIL